MPAEVPGRFRSKTPGADAPIACKTPAAVEVFDEVIQLTVFLDHKPPSERTSRFVAAAKSICASCPVRMQCLEIHGRDFEIGVVGGLTDKERRALYAEATA